MRRRRGPPGSRPDIFLPQGCAGPPGSQGQFILWDQPFTKTGDPRGGDRFGWPIDHLTSRLVLDWAPGDGDQPFIGPELDITDGGGPDESDVSPWVDRNGVMVPSAYFDGTVGRRTATHLDPSSGQDVRVMALVWPANDRSASFNRIFSTRDSGPGVTLFYKPDVSRFSFYCYDDVGGVSSIGNDFFGWSLLDGFWDLDGNITFRINGSLIDTDAAPGGDHSPGDGLGVGVFPDGSGKWVGRIARVLVYFGTDLDHSTDHASIASSVLGIRNVQRNGVPTHTRGSVAVTKRSTHYHLIGQGAPRAGGDEGLLVEPAGTNKIYNNVNPAATTGWTQTGGTKDIIDDSAQLQSNGVLEFGPNVMRFSNSSGSAQVIYSGAPTGNTNPHSLSVFARYSSGANAELGLYDLSSGVFTPLATIADNYARTTYANVTPSDTDQYFAIRIPDGCVLRFVVGQLEESPIVSSPIPNLATAATATRAQDVLTTTHIPSESQGSVSADIEPVGWSGAEGANGNIITRALVRYINSDGGKWSFSDGTNTAEVLDAPADGVEQTIRSRWGGGGISIDVDGGRDAATYDGGLQGSGAVTVDGINPTLIRNFRAYRNGSG